MRKTPLNVVIGRASCALASAFLCLFGVGCNATVEYKRADTSSESTTGIRYYEAAPYLLIYSDGMGGLKWQILSLPDQSHIMTATPISMLGKTQMTLSFQNGTLSSASSGGDTTAVPNAIFAAAQAAVPLIVAGVAEAKAAPVHPIGFPAPYLYKIVVNSDAGGVSFIGGPGDVTIRVPVPKAPGT
jgi:hypothetical protein